MPLQQFVVRCIGGVRLSPKGSADGTSQLRLQSPLQPPLFALPFACSPICLQSHLLGAPYTKFCSPIYLWYKKLFAVPSICGIKHYLQSPTFAVPFIRSPLCLQSHFYVAR